MTFQLKPAILHQGFTQLPVPAKITRACQTLAFQTRVQLNPFRASSTENTRADDLSRGRIDQEDPSGRLHLSIQDIMSSIFDHSASHLARLRGVKR